MVITKTGSRVNYLLRQKELANHGCYNCPECGAPNAGSALYSSWASGIFKLKNMRQDSYHCDICGCEWKSDPYEW